MLVEVIYIEVVQKYIDMLLWVVVNCTEKKTEVFICVYPLTTNSNLFYYNENFKYHTFTTNKHS